MDVMNTNRRHAVAALIAAGLLWGTTVPLSKLALQWLAPGWLTAARFGLAAAVLLPIARRRVRVRGHRLLEAKVLGSGSGRVRGDGHRAERRDRPDQRHARGAADRGDAGAGRDHRRGMAAGRGPAGRMAGLCHLAGRGGPGHRGRRRRGRERSRGRAGTGLAGAVGHVYRGAGPAAARPRPGRGHRGAVPRRCAGRAGLHRGRRGRACGPGPARSRAGRGRAGAGRDAGAVHAVRFRAEPGPGRGRRGVPQHRAAGRRHGGDRVLRRPGGPEAAGRRPGRRRGDRAERGLAALSRGAGRAGSGRRARAGHARSWPDASRGTGAAERSPGRAGPVPPRSAGGTLPRGCRPADRRYVPR